MTSTTPRARKYMGSRVTSRIGIPLELKWDIISFWNPIAEAVRQYNRVHLQPAIRIGGRYRWSSTFSTSGKASFVTEEQRPFKNSSSERSLIAMINAIIASSSYFLLQKKINLFADIEYKLPLQAFFIRWHIGGGSSMQEQDSKIGNYVSGLVKI